MTIHFPDLSHHKQVSLDGALALITKATEGLSYVDPSYAGYKADASKRGIPFCAFHWLHAADVPGQARHAFAVVGPNVPLMIDDEDPVDGLSVSRTLAFVKAYRALGGTVTLEYLPHWFWANHGSPDLRPLSNAGLSLVSSAYPKTGYSDTGVGWLPYGGMSPAIWQWSDAHPFNGQLVDFNAYKGTVDELRRLFTGASEGGSLVGVEEWAATAGAHSWALTQGNPGYVGQQRDTALAFAWEAAHNAARDAAAAKAAAEKSVAMLQQILEKLAAGGTAGGPTHDELAQAAFEGAQRAERE